MCNILLISAPGAGKGITAEYLKDNYNLVHMSIGNLLRKVSKDNPLVKELVDEGKFVPNEIVYATFEQYLISNPDSNYIFDGFPRMVEQIKPFESILNKHNISLDKIIFINIDKNIALKRIAGRFICEDCNEIYNNLLDDISSMKCKKCNSNLVKREDDNEETYLNRYSSFEKITMPVSEYFKNNYENFYEISNNTTLEDMYQEIDYVMNKN